MSAANKNLILNFVFYVDKSDPDCLIKFLYGRYQKGSTVGETCNFHPVTEGVVAYKQLSNDENRVGSRSYSLGDLPSISYVACKYHEQWWVGMVLEVDWATNDLKITFMHPCSPSD